MVDPFNTFEPFIGLRAEDKIEINTLSKDVIDAIQLGLFICNQ